MRKEISHNKDIMAQTSEEDKICDLLKRIPDVKNNDIIIEEDFDLFGISMD